MALKRYYDNPKVTDQIEFDMYMPDATGCFNDDPFKIINIKIYFIVRDLSNLKNNLTLVDSYSINQQKAYLEAQQLACENPTEINVANAQRLKDAFDSSTVVNPNFYSQANIIFNQGTPDNPLWLRGGANTNSIVEKIVNPESEIQYGYFKFIWSPDGSIREGDFYICYTYQPNISGSSIAEYIHFYVKSNIANDVANPAHVTKPQKYVNLLEKYLPDMYNQNYAKQDLSVQTLTKMNAAVAEGFTEIENLANQLIDIVDANATQEPLLGYLANFFGIRLRSTDITLWRRQIKKAVPVCKRKGTLNGLEQALGDAGIRLLKYSQFWQTGSDYAYTETFTFVDSNSFVLTYVSLPINSSYFELHYRTATSNYAMLDLSNISIATTNGVSTMTWSGFTLSPGDVLRVTYQTKAFATPEQAFIHEYIKQLPLADTRDDRNFEYPPKDWNTKLIANDDVLFDVIVNTQNPFVPDINFGRIRTSFPYSENVYNMEEYNGSLRDSTLPCDIDKSFVDPCRSSISSYYSLDVDISSLSNNRLQECQEIISEYTPFHATLHTLNFQGQFEDFVLPPIEECEALIRYVQEDTMIAGMAQTVFNRAMFLGLQGNSVLRNSLATMTTQASGSTTAFNEFVNLYCQNVNFETLGLSKTPASTLLEILAPAYYAGQYTVQNPNVHNLRIVETVTEPLNVAEFSFRLSNITFADIGFNIVQANQHTMTDASIDWSFFDIKSIWDVNQGYAASPWQVTLVSSGFTYNIKSFVNNIIELEDDNTLSNTPATNVDYILLDGNSSPIYSSNTAVYSVKELGKVTVPASLGIEDVRNVLKPNTYFYRDTGAAQYAFYSYVDSDTQSFLVSGWTSGTVTDSGKILQRLVSEDVGSLSYEGMKVLKPGGWPVFDDPESYFFEDNNFKENYILVIGGSNYYFIDRVVDGSGCLSIGGKFMDWGTQSGTSVSYTLYRFAKDTAELFGEQLVDLSRNGQEIINKITQYLPTPMMMAPAATSNSGGPTDDMISTESVGFTIQYKDGTQQKGAV